MEKRVNRYHLTLKLLQDAKGLVAPGKELTMEFENHDEIFDIIERIKEKGLFESDDEASEFAIGLKMFSDVMIKQKHHPLFEDLVPAFQAFMKQLKNSEGLVK